MSRAGVSLKSAGSSERRPHSVANVFLFAVEQIESI